ncbi:hypothetical protein ZWY2020_046171 [Hordeum vulgare]|nr:hypothetical protein ZWY2020_046171 [Hordeum vulgare]
MLHQAQRRGNELQEDIVMWHIATDIYLAKRVVVTDGDHTTVGHIEVLSNYMMFLLVNHPDLLPGLVLHRMYEISRANLVMIWCNRDPDHENPRVRAGARSVWQKLFRLHDEPVLSSMTMDSQKNRLANILDKLLRKLIASEEEAPNTDQKKNDATSSRSEMPYRERKSDGDNFFCDSLYRVEYGARIAYKLLDKDTEKKDLRSPSTSLNVILDVWLDFLFYVANKCSRESYAKKLSSGVELTAILWLMGAHSFTGLLLILRNPSLKRTRSFLVFRHKRV